VLGHLRVLDCTDDRALLAGRMLADLGADVVQVEPPGGARARQRPPRPPDGGTSYVWTALAAGKRSVVLDLTTTDGRAELHRLAAGADVLLTTWSPEQAQAMGLDEAGRGRTHPHLVHVAVTPFGQTGPKADWAATDLTLWAAGGPLEEHRDGTRAPLRISVPQAWLHGAADAAAGALVALTARQRTGLGQLVDVSVQASVGVATLSRVLAHAVEDTTIGAPSRGPDQSGSGSATSALLKKWNVKDGLVEFHLAMGRATGQFTNNFFQWVHGEGGCDDEVAALDWRTLPKQIGNGSFPPERLEAVRRTVADFLAQRTKAEVLDAAVRHRLLCVPILDAADLAVSEQLRSRDFWVHDLPGRSSRVTGGPLGPVVRGPAPALGEHDVQWEPRPAAEPTLPSGQPLAGLKVLDLSWVVAGPLIGRALADFGAQVVRVESQSKVETARLMLPFYGGVPGPENAALYVNCNAGKLGLALDLSTEQGRGVVRDLAVWADVVVESFSPGTMARWGLDFETLRSANPSLVMLSTSLMGQTGPHSALAGFGNLGASLSGFQHVVGWPDRPPIGPFGPYTDFVGPRFSLTTLLAALEHRRLTGEGCWIDVAQVEAGVFFQSAEVAACLGDGQVAQRLGNADLEHAPHGVYPCRERDGRERWVALAVRDDVDWTRLVQALGLPDEPLWASADGRRDDRTRLDDLLAQATAPLTAEDVERRLQTVGVPAHVVSSSRDWVQDVQLAHRGHVLRLPHPLHGEAVVEAPRCLLSETPGVVTAPAPVYGQHTQQVLTEMLGYSAERIQQLADAGVLT
jgi:crotonobetainyl-CoA:carnitine CoA-transferase CaiB-like acyl-CoA transferase